MSRKRWKLKENNGDSEHPKATKATKAKRKKRLPESSTRKHHLP